MAGIFAAGVGHYDSSVTVLNRSQIRYATRPFITASDDTPPDTPIEARLSPFDLERSLEFGEGGVVAPVAGSAVGILTLENMDGALDDVDDEVALVGRNIELSVAAMPSGSITTGITTFDVITTEDSFTITTEDGFDLSTGGGGSAAILAGFGLVFNGVIEAIGWDHAKAQIIVRDFRLKMKQPVQRNVYSGVGGGLDGEGDLAGLTKPKAFGAFRNARPVLLDAARQIYQLHDGEMRAIDAVFDRGVALEPMARVGRFDELVNLVTESTSEEDSPVDLPLGAFAPCPAAGCFRLGGIPDGIVTANGRGGGGTDASTEPFSDGTGFTDGTAFKSSTNLLYARTATQVIERIFRDIGFTENEVNFAQIQQIGEKRPYPVGIFLAAGERRTVEEVIGICAASVGCVLIRSLDGLYQLREFGRPARSPVVSIVLSMQDAQQLQRRSLPYRQPWSDVDIVYNRNWSPMSASDLAGAVENRNSFIVPELVARVTDDEIAIVYPDRAPLRIETVLVSDRNARSVGEMLLAFYSRGRRMFSVSVRGVAYRLDLMDTVRLVSPRYGLSGGINMVIVGIRENGTTLATELDLFG